MGDPGFMLSKCSQFSWCLSLLFLLLLLLPLLGVISTGAVLQGGPARACIEDLIGNHGGKRTFFSLAGSCGDVAWANLSLQRAVLPGKGASVGESRPERKEAKEASDDIL